MDITTPAYILQERADRDARAQAHRIYEDFIRRNEAEFNAITDGAMTPELAATIRVANIFRHVQTEENYDAAVRVLVKTIQRIGKEFFDATNGISGKDPAFYAAYGEVLREALNNYVIPKFN